MQSRNYFAHSKILVILSEPDVVLFKGLLYELIGRTSLSLKFILPELKFILPELKFLRWMNTLSNLFFVGSPLAL